MYIFCFTWSTWRNIMSKIWWVWLVAINKIHEQHSSCDIPWNPGWVIGILPLAYLLPSLNSQGFGHSSHVQMLWGTSCIYLRRQMSMSTRYFVTQCTCERKHNMYDSPLPIQHTTRSFLLVTCGAYTIGVACWNRTCPNKNLSAHFRRFHPPHLPNPGNWNWT